VRALGYGSNPQILDLFGDDERLSATLQKDPTHSEAEGLIEIYKRQRPGEPPTEESARSLLNSLFFDKRYDLARVGRYKFNKKLAIRARIRAEHGAFTAGDAAWYAWVAPRLYRFGLERPTREVLETFLGGPVSPAALLADMRRMGEDGRAQHSR